MGADGFGFGGWAGLGGAFLGLIFFIFGVAAAWAFCLANSLACAATADQTLSDIKRQSANWSFGSAISVNLISGLLFIHLFSKIWGSVVPYLDWVINRNMRIFELIKPKTPGQLRIDQLSAASKRAMDAVKQERLRQKTQRTQQALQRLRNPGLKAPV